MDDDSNLSNHEGISQQVINAIPPDFNVEEALSKDLLGLSIKDRSAIEEELHGVSCSAVEETPELLDTSLRKFDLQLTIEANCRRAKGEAHQNEETYRDVLRNVDSMYSHSSEPQSNNHPNCYLNDPDLRLRFLRIDLFDPEKAAKRLVKFLELASELFGDFVCERPIESSDFSTHEEQEALRSSRCQLLPFRDRSGRRIMISCGSCLADLEDYLQDKIYLFMAWASTEDVETQRNGNVILLWPTSDNGVWDTKILPNWTNVHMCRRLKDAAPVRYVSIHFCVPDMPIFRALSKVVVHCLPPDRRNILRIHFGQPMEIQYQLLGYGIPVDIIPLSYTGTVKTVNHLQWIKALELKRHGEISNIVICPNKYDVLYRKGQRWIYKVHPGNMYFRGMIESISEKHENGSRQEKIDINNWLKTEVMKVGGRFLQWVSTKNTWEVIDNPSMVRTKIAISIREYRRGLRSQRGQPKASKQDQHQSPCIKADLNSQEADGTRVNFINGQKDSFPNCLGCHCGPPTKRQKTCFAKQRRNFD